MRKNFQLKKRCLLLVFLFIACVSTNSWASAYSRIVAFGDSLSDHGGLSAYSATIAAYGGPATIPESWTNDGAIPYGGDIWLDYLSDEWNATLDNNAIGGAMSIGHESGDIQALIDATLLPDLGLSGQVAAWLAESPDYDAKKTLFAIWIGGNDLLEFFRQEYYTNDANTLISETVGRIITQMEMLYADGARNFLVINLPDLAKTPAFNTKDATVQAQVATVVAGFNATLSSALADFSTANTDTTVYAVDAFTYLNSIIADDVFADSTSTYLTVDENCDWVSASFNGSFDEFLFFDCIHPTTKSHELVAAEVAGIIAAEAKDNNDDDDTCFIASARNSQIGYTGVFVISGVLLTLGFAGLILKKD